MKSTLAFFNLLIYLVFLSSCSSATKDKTQVEKIVYVDSLHRWLDDERNFQQPEYGNKFNEGFQQKIKLGAFDSALKYLNAYGRVVDIVFVYDSLLVLSLLETKNKYEKNIDTENKCNINYYLGSQYNLLGDFTKSDQYLNEAVKDKAETNTHKEMQGYAYIVLSANALSQHLLEKAEQYAVSGLHLFEKIGDVTNQGTMYTQLHAIYLRSYSYAEAEKAILKNMELSRQVNDSINIFNSFSNMVNLRRSTNDTIQMQNYADSLRLFYEKWSSHSPRRDLYCYYFNAVAATYSGKKDLALFYLDTVMRLNIKNNAEYNYRSNMLEILVTNSFNLPYTKTATLDSLYEGLKKSDSPNLPYLVNVLSAQSKNFEANGNYKGALEKEKEISTLLAKITELRLNGKLHELQKKYESEKKERTILRQEQQLTKRMELIWELTALLALLSLSGLLLYIWQRKKSIQKEKEISQTFTRQLLEKTEEERKRIASDLHDSVSNNLVVLSRNLTQETTQLKQKIDGVIEEIRVISRNLHPVMFDRVGLQISLEQLIERVQLQNDFMLSADIDYKNSLSSEKELQLYRILQESITNMVKYSEAIAGKITIKESEKAILIEIKDNGKGFDVQKTLDSGKAFGLHNIIERSKAIGGEAQITSGKTGTIITINIPKK